VRPFYERQEGPGAKKKVNVLTFLYRYRRDENFTRV